MSGNKNISLEIKVDQHLDSKIYTSGSFISGRVDIIPHAGFVCETLEIFFRGVTSSRVSLCQHATLPAKHEFLRLYLPVPHELCPTNQILQAGNFYSIPFAFNILHRLPDTACEHKDSLIRDRHLELPPTVGSLTPDDLMSRGIRIDYTIEARLGLAQDNGKMAKYVKDCHLIRLLPHLPERPPLCVGPKSPMYRMSQEKVVKMHLFSRKGARLIASATQPRPIVLSDGLCTSGSVIKVDFECTPISGEVPLPNIYAQSCSLEANETHSLGHMEYLPDQQKQYPMGSGFIVSDRTSHRFVLGKAEKIGWQQISKDKSKDKSDPYVKDYSSASTDAARKGSTARSDIIEAGHPVYKGRMLLPIKLPNTLKKFFLPTFYSCLASRTYTVRLSLAVEGCGTTFALTMPLQIASESYTLPPYIESPGYVSKLDGTGIGSKIRPI